MSVIQTTNADGTVTFSITTKPEGTFLQQEEQIQEAVNELGNALTEHYLTQFDTQAPAIKVAEQKYTLKGVQKKSTRPSTAK